MPKTFLKIVTIPVTIPEPDFDFSLDQAGEVIYKIICRSKFSSTECKEVSKVSAGNQRGWSYRQPNSAEETPCA